jgi:hypothetical protein
LKELINDFTYTHSDDIPKLKKLLQLVHVMSETM